MTLVLFEKCDRIALAYNWTEEHAQFVVSLFVHVRRSKRSNGNCDATSNINNIIIKKNISNLNTKRNSIHFLHL